LNSFLLSIHSFTLIIQPAGNFFAALDDSGDEGAKPKPPQPKKETAKKSSAPSTQPAKKNDDGKRYVFDVLTKSCVAVLDVGACLGLFVVNVPRSLILLLVVMIISYSS